MADQEPQAPKIEFPCTNYPVKIIGDSHDQFISKIMEVVKRHAPEVDEERISVRDSSNGRFVSVQVHITATGPEQLQKLNEDLRDTGVVRMVL